MKRKNIYIILLLSMFALTSCKVGKSYVRPEMALPDSLAQQQDSMSIGSLYGQHAACFDRPCSGI